MSTTCIFECKPPYAGVVVAQPTDDPVVASLPCVSPVSSVHVEFTSGQLIIRVVVDEEPSEPALTIAADAAEQARQVFVAVSTFYFDPPQRLEPPLPPPTWIDFGPFFPVQEEPPALPPFFFGDSLKHELESGAASGILADAYVETLGIPDVIAQFLMLWALVGTVSDRKSVSGIDDFLASMGVPQDRASDFMPKHPLWTEYGELRNRISHVSESDIVAVKTLVNDVAVRIASFRLWTRRVVIGR